MERGEQYEVRSWSRTARVAGVCLIASTVVPADSVINVNEQSGRSEQALRYWAEEFLPRNKEWLCIIPRMEGLPCFPFTHNAQNIVFGIIKKSHPEF